MISDLLSVGHSSFQMFIQRRTRHFFSGPRSSATKDLPLISNQISIELYLLSPSVVETLVTFARSIRMEFFSVSSGRTVRAQVLTEIIFWHRPRFPITKSCSTPMQL